MYIHIYVYVLTYICLYANMCANNLYLKVNYCIEM